jgi:hypothetical protein
MKPTSTRYVLLAAVSVAVLLTSACQSASLVRSNPPANVAVPVVLQANPDILGGLVGREAVGALGTPRREVDTAQLQRAQFDQRAYVIWKQSQKS